MPASRLLVPCALLASLATSRAADPPSFSTQIAPLLREHCLKCHSGPRARGDLALTSRASLLTGGTSGPTLVPGKADRSLLFTHVRDGKMPPRQPLPAVEIERLRRWIDAGAKWEGGPLASVAPPAPGRAGRDWWSLQPIRQPAVPAVKARERMRTPIDAFLLAKLEEKGLTFRPEADRASLIRRLTFDLIGLAPTPDQIDAFVHDARPDAYERLVDRLLASPRHGERWARHWLDVVRFAESHGYEMNTLRPSAWPYRDYVIRAFNQDIGFRSFVREQLAGDVIASDDPLVQAATGFLVAGPHDLVGNGTIEGRLQQRADDLADMASALGNTFLGLTVGCARCHDHKFDPVTQKEFHAIEAIFAGIEHAERDLPMPVLRGEVARRPAVNPRQNEERFAPVMVRFVRFTILATTDGSEPCIDELEIYGPDARENLALASRGVKPSASSVYPDNPLHRLEHLNDGRVGNARSWISAERGKGWVQLELPAAVRIDRVVWGRDRQEKYRDRLARSYRLEVSENGRTWKTVSHSDDRTGPAQTTRVYAGRFRGPDVIHRLNRGDVMQKLEVIGPGTVAAIAPALAIPAGTSESARRVALADWLTHPDNPLPARVLVNRMWHWHFGQGIVRTPSDFGYNGDRPSHPELLDYLTAGLRDSQGGLKTLHRQIVLSSAYRQSSRADVRGQTLDAGNRLLWRFTPRRLEAEAIRDSMLQVSGALDPRMGGPGYHLWDYSGYVIVFQPRAKLGAETFRRMIYQFKPRLQQDRTFGAFDCPDATSSQPRRNVSTTALQALNLLNDPFVLDQAGRFAERVRREAARPAEQIDRAFRLAFGRTPSPVEKAAAERLTAAHGLEALCRALYNANEFVFVP